MEYFTQQLINGVTLGAIYALIAIGYTMVYGIIGMINFAHGEVFMIGAFISIITFLLLGLFGIPWAPPRRPDHRDRHVHFPSELRPARSRRADQAAAIPRHRRNRDHATWRLRRDARLHANPDRRLDRRADGRLHPSDPAHRVGPSAARLRAGLEDGGAGRRGRGPHHR